MPTDFVSFLSMFSSIVPVTVVVALLIFISKEFLESIRKTKTKKNKLASIKFMLSEEIKLNHWAFKCVFRTYETIAELLNDYENPQFKVKFDRFGNCHFKWKADPSDDIWSGHSIPDFHRRQYNSLLSQISELDLDLAKAIEETYSELADLEHYRQTIILFVTNELDEEEVFRKMTKSFIKDFCHEKKDFFGSMENTYRKVAGKELTEFRLR